jgi:hypothetical protein
MLSDQPVSAKGYLRLSAEKDLLVTLLPADLRSEKGEPILRNAMTLPTEIALKQHQPKDVLVQVDGIREAGTYVGTLELSYIDAAHPKVASTKKTATITVKALALPKLALVGTQPVVWTLVRCGNRISCWVVDTLLPSAMHGSERHLVVEDQRNAAIGVDLLLLTVSANGAEVQPTRVVAGELAGSNGTRKTFRLAATFDRQTIHAGAYSAIAQMKPRERGDVLTQSLTLDVRMGPFAALLAIAIGIVVGRMSQSLATPLFQFQSGLLARVYLIKSDAERLTDSAVRTLILERLRNVIDRIELASGVDNGIVSDVDAIAAQLLAGMRLDRLVTAVAGIPDAARRSALQAQVDEIRMKILGGSTKDAVDQLDKAEADAGTPRMRAPAFARTPQAAASGGQPPKRRTFTRVVNFLAGAPGPASVRVKYGVVRPSLFLVLLFVLCMVGFNTLYVKASAGFGSAGLFDLFGLFIWGLTADVAQSTLQRLPK